MIDQHVKTIYMSDNQIKYFTDNGLIESVDGQLYTSMWNRYRVERIGLLNEKAGIVKVSD